MRALVAPIVVTAVLASAAPALASSLPKADISRPTLGLGLGNGASLSLDFPVTRELSLGGGLGAPSFRSGSLDLRLLYNLMRGGRERVYLSLLAGAQFYGPTFGSFGTPEAMIGVALAYPFTSQLTGRLNVVAGLGTAGIGLTTMRPSGLELGYKFTPTLEGTLGYNGRGDVIGLKFGF